MDQIVHITTFVKVVERGGFAAAARDLNIAPSIVSARIQALEERLGARLLNRTTRRVSPTESGSIYYARCVDILRRLDDANDCVASMQTTPRGELRLNVSFLLPGLVSDVIAQYTERYPDVEIRMMVTGRMVDLIDDHYDLAIRHRIPTGDTFIIRKLADFRLIVCGSPAYFERRTRPSVPSDLANHNCLICTESEAGEKWPLFGSDNDLIVKGNLHTNSIAALVQAAKNGQGLAVAPDFAVKEALRTGQLISVLSESITARFPIVAIYPHRGLPTKVRLFIAMLAAHLKALPALDGSIPPLD